MKGITGLTGYSMSSPTGDTGVNGYSTLTGVDGITGLTGTSFIYTGSTGPTGLFVSGDSGSLGPTGHYNSLSFISSTTLSGNTTIISNVFSSKYDNYKIHISNLNTDTSTDKNLLFKLSSNSVVDSSDTYRLSYGWVSVLSNGAGGEARGASNTTSFLLGTLNNTSSQGVNIEIQSPFLSKRTIINYWGGIANDSRVVEWHGSGTHIVDSSYDGFQLSLTGNNFSSGTTSIYGYK